MSRPLQLTSWQQHLANRFPELPAPAVVVLALYSFGMILAKVSGLSTVALFLGKHLGWPYDALRKRLSEFYKEASAKSGVREGVKRRDLDVTTCFGPLLRWILSLWSGRCLPLALDVTNLGDRFHVLCISVVVRGVGIPIAWKVLYGGLKDPWNPHWQALLEHLDQAVPPDWTVIVLSDRGLESAELFRFIARLNWHPLMRVKKGGKFRPTGWGRCYRLGELVRKVGDSLSVEGRAYAGEQMACTLLACWKAGYDEPWLLLTNLPPEAGHAVWYAFRAWIEQGFKVIKGGGWDWQKTRMEDPARVERLWLVLAVATLWVVAVGAADEVQQEIADELKRLQREMSQTQEQAQARWERDRLRLEKQKEALRARQARKQQREAAKQQQRAQTRAKKKAKARKAGDEVKTNATGPAAGRASKQDPPRQRASKEEGAKARAHRVSARGLAELAALWKDGKNRLPQCLHPEVWPPPCHPASTLTEAEFLSQQT
jgi:DDE family transposase